MIYPIYYYYYYYSVRPGEISYADAKSKQAKVADEDEHMITIRMQPVIFFFFVYKLLLQNLLEPRP